MSAFDSLRTVLLELPISDLYKARLDFALEQASALERQISALQLDNAKLDAQLRAVTAERNDLRKELQRIKDEHAEDIRIHKAIEFRRGKRTGGKWLPFCPRCHQPAVELPTIRCSDSDCQWLTLEIGPDTLAAELQ